MDLLCSRFEDARIVSPGGFTVLQGMSGYVGSTLGYVWGISGHVGGTLRYVRVLRGMLRVLQGMSGVLQGMLGVLQGITYTRDLKLGLKVDPILTLY